MMKKKILLIKKIVILTIIQSILAMQPVAQSNYSSDFYQGSVDGKHDAKGDPWWMAAGMLLIYGNLAAYLIKPDPPPEALIGKPSDYVRGYTESYKKESALKNLRYSCIGSCITAVLGIISLAVVLPSLAEAESKREDNCFDRNCSF